MTAATTLLLFAFAFLALLFSCRVRPRMVAPGIAMLAVASGGAALWRLEWQAAPATGLALVLATVLLWLERHGRATRGHRRSPALAAVAALGIMLTVLPYGFFPVFDLPSPTGPFPVGLRRAELVDHSRTNVLRAGEGVPRRIKVKLWYPAESTVGHSGEHTASRYWTHREAWVQGRSLAQHFGVPWFQYLGLGRVGTNSHMDVPVAAHAGPFPFVIFSHGFWSYLSQNTALMEELASHGYVVASLSHAGDSATVLFADGTTAAPLYSDPGNPQDSARDEKLVAALKAFMGQRGHDARTASLNGLKEAVGEHRLQDSFDAWRDDMLFLENALRRGNGPAGIRDIVASTDFSRTGAVGMSFGGTMAATHCHLTASCLAAVNLDGENFDFDLYDRDIDAALLMLLTDQPFYDFQARETGFNPSDYAYERWSRMGERADVVRWRLRGMRHLGLTDLHLLARTPFRESLYGPIGRTRGIRAVNDITRRFLDRHIKGQPTAFPAGLQDRYPEFEAHDPSAVARWWQDSHPR
jgi:predicted dienelactone hydrolase